MTFLAHGNGGTNGVNVTTSDASSGNLWAQVDVDADDRFEYTTDSFLGGMGYRYSTRDGTANGRVYATHTPLPEVFNKWYFKFDDIVSGTRMCTCRQGIAQSYGCWISLLTTDQIRLGNGDTSNVWTSPTLTIGEWYKIEHWYSAVALRSQVWIYRAIDESPVADSGSQPVTQTAGFSTVGAIAMGMQVGEPNRPSTTGWVYLDEIDLFQAVLGATHTAYPRRGLAAVS